MKRRVTESSLMETARMVGTSKALARIYPDLAKVYLEAAEIFQAALMRDLRWFLRSELQSG